MLPDKGLQSKESPACQEAKNPVETAPIRSSRSLHIMHTTRRVAVPGNAGPPTCAALVPHIVILQG